MKPKMPQTARFVVIATQYGQSASGGISDPMPRSSISPYRLDMDKLTQVLLRFETPRAFHHPDDNDLRLCCSSELHASLKAGMRGVGTWQGDRLLSFTPDDLQGLVGKYRAGGIAAATFLGSAEENVK